MSSLDHPPLCLYCGHPVDPVADTWIGGGVMAHSPCAWAAEEAFWATLDVEEGKEEKADASQSS